MNKQLRDILGETSVIEKKREVERSKPKSWLKSVSAFANGGGGTLFFGISDADEVVGLVDVKRDSEYISELVKAKLDPIPHVEMALHREDEKDIVVLTVRPGNETPYYYIGDGQRLAFIRIGNESVVADRVQLKALVLKGAGVTFDSLPSVYRFEDMSFTRLKSIHYKVMRRSFEETDFSSWGIVNEEGNLTNAGALIADDCPYRQARVFCTRWNGLTKTSGLGEAIDDIELGGSIIGQLQDAVSFVRVNSKRKWWKGNETREELPDYPDRAIIEAITNALIHRDYMQLGSEIHLDMYDDRLEIYSPGGMCDGREIQNLDFSTVASKRRNPLLADFFARLGFMERRGSGLRKIVNSYDSYERLTEVHRPEFVSDSTEFRICLWNLNYSKEAGETDESGKEAKKQREFLRIVRQIYQCIENNPTSSANAIAVEINVSPRQVQRCLKVLREKEKIMRTGGRKIGQWKIVDADYTKGFDREGESI